MVGNLNGNYTTVEPGNFSIVPAGGSDTLPLTRRGLTKTYDGQPVAIYVSPRPASTAPPLLLCRRFTWSDANPASSKCRYIYGVCKATHDGYEESAPVKIATVVINPAPVTIAVADTSKVASMTILPSAARSEALWPAGIWNDINYVRPGGEEAAGVYVEAALTALYARTGTTEGRRAQQHLHHHSYSRGARRRPADTSDLTPTPTAPLPRRAPFRRTAR